MIPKNKIIKTPRVKVIQKLYSSLMNPDIPVEFTKSQYKKFIKDVVNGTLEREELIEDTIRKHLSNDINLYLHVFNICVFLIILIRLSLEMDEFCNV